MNYLKKIIYSILRIKYILTKNAKIGAHFVVGKNVNIDTEFQCGNHIYIGQNSYIGPKTTLGHYVMLADMVNIIGHDHAYNNVGIPIILSGKPKIQPETTIGNDVWIGHGVTILRGVNIGDGAIIGANSLVSKDIEPYTINVGIPCKFLKFRFLSKKAMEEHIMKLNSKLKKMD